MSYEYLESLLTSYPDKKPVAFNYMKARDDVATLIAEVHRLRSIENWSAAEQEMVERVNAENELLKIACEDMAYIIGKVAHNRCEYCILRTEPCSVKELSLNAECCFEYCGLEANHEY